MIRSALPSFSFYEVMMNVGVPLLMSPPRFLVAPLITLILGVANGKSWEQRGELPGTAEALTVKSATWYAATAKGIHASADSGRTWTAVLENR